jgi:hypothetical protein
MIVRTSSCRAWIQGCCDVRLESVQRKFSDSTLLDARPRTANSRVQRDGSIKGSYVYYRFALRRVQYVILSGERLALTEVRHISGVLVAACGELSLVTCGASKEISRNEGFCCVSRIGTKKNFASRA